MLINYYLKYTNVSESPGILFEEGSYSGKVYHLSAPRTRDVGFGLLREQLEGEAVKLDGVDLESCTDLFIPEIFKPEDGEIPDEATIQGVKEFNQRGVRGIVGYVKHNDSSTVVYEGREVLMLESTKMQFVIFESDGEMFLSMLGSRSLVSSVLKLISGILKNVGFAVSDIYITHDGFEGIAEEIVDTLKITTISGYPSPNLSKKVLHGDGYGSDREYLREAKVGAVAGQQFGTRAVSPDDEKTVQISDDGLVRSYSNMMLVSYIDLLANYIIDNAQYQVQSSLTSYSTSNMSV